jgi:hypothetical protein
MRRAAVSEAMVSDADDKDEEDVDADKAVDALLPCSAGSDEHRGTEVAIFTNVAAVTAASRAFSNSSRRRK